MPDAEALASPAIPVPRPQVQPPEVRLAAPGTVRLSGAWDIRALETLASSLQSQLATLPAARDSSWDLTGIQRLDHIGALMLWRAWGGTRPTRAQILPEHESFFATLAAPRPDSSEAPLPAWLRALYALGAWIPLVVSHTRGFVALLGALAVDTLDVLRRPHLGPWREVSASVYRTGAQALGITGAVGFLIGIVLSYLSSEQLKTFGAGVFIVNILGIGLIRELGPVLCAVLVAGRSGSSMTAQLGVMRVTEELDALSVMGIPQTVRLVLPKLLALAIAVPLLTLWTTGIALLGGALAAQAQLEISVFQFMSDLPSVVPVANLWLGLGKGVVFGMLIALIACHFGLRIEPNTESLGVGTTNSVVSSITAVIVADALLAVAFNDVGFS
jgi:phospholipid/cholesterol/gamma-HCH transport system permease protein